MVHRQSYLESLSTQVPDCWLQSFTEGLVDGESGSSSSAGERIPKTSPPRVAARLKQTQDSTTQLNNHPKYFIGTALNAGGGWRPNRMRQLNNTTPQPTQQLVNFEAVTAGVSLKLVVRLKRLAILPLSLRPSSSVLLSDYRTMHARRVKNGQGRMSSSRGLCRHYQGLSWAHSATPSRTRPRSCGTIRRRHREAGLQQGVCAALTSRVFSTVASLFHQVHTWMHGRAISCSLLKRQDVPTNLSESALLPLTALA